MHNKPDYPNKLGILVIHTTLRHLPCFTKGMYYLFFKTQIFTLFFISKYKTIFPCNILLNEYSICQSIITRL